MAITFIPFTPTPTQAFAFQATLDGNAYQITVAWNVSGARWYLLCTDAGGTLIFYLPLIGSPDTGDINIVAGYFIANTLVFRVSTQTFEVGP